MKRIETNKQFIQMVNGVKSFTKNGDFGCFDLGFYIYLFDSFTS